MKKILIPFLILIIIVIVGLVSLSGGKKGIIYESPILSNSQDLKTLMSRESENLTTYKLIDTANSIYSIPIDSAINIYISENNS